MRIVDIDSSPLLDRSNCVDSLGAKPNGRKTCKADEDQQDGAIATLEMVARSPLGPTYLHSLAHVRSASSSCATVATVRAGNSSPVDIVGTSLDSRPSPTTNSMKSLTQGLNFISGEVMVVT